MDEKCLYGKLTSTIEIKSSAQRFFQFMVERTYDFPLASPNEVQRVILVSGLWGEEGSIIFWYYTLGKL